MGHQPLPTDNEKKVWRGKPLRLAAATWNKVVDAVKAHTRRAGAAAQGPGGDDTDTLLPANTIFVKNSLSTDLTTSFGITGLGDPLLTPDSDPVNLAERLAFAGAYPKAANPFAIFQEPVEENGIGKAAAAGVSICYVLMNAADDEWAVAIDDTPTHLESAGSGGTARILWHDAGGDPPVDGAELAIVLLGAGGSNREYRIHCDDETNLLVWQYSDDGGTTWITDESVDTGIACSSTDPSPSGCDPSGWGWVAGLLYIDDPEAEPPVHFSDCLKLTVLSASGFCAGISTAQVLHLRTGDGITWRSQEWDCDPEPGEWIDEDFVCDPDTVNGAAVFTVDDTTGFPTLTVCGVSHKLTLTCGGNGVVVFTGGGPDYCDGAVPSAACQDNTFAVKLECECCSIDGWMGPGWYCVLDEGDACGDVDATFLVTELLEADRCDDSIVICSCRYDSEGEADAACNPSCPPTGVDAPASMTATITVTGGTCTIAAGATCTVTNIATIGQPPQYTGEFELPNGGRTIQLLCSGDGVWTFSCAGFSTDCAFRENSLAANCASWEGTLITPSPLHIRVAGQIHGSFDCTPCDDPTDIRIDFTE